MSHKTHSKVNCLLVDDEPIARDILNNYLNRLGGYQVVASLGNPEQAFQYLQEEPVDLVFLDIQMSGLSGLELLRSLTHRPKVILTTAHREYAMEGYDLGVVDYLLKPISFQRFLQAVNKAHPFERPATDANGSADYHDFIFVKSDKKLVKVSLGDILYIEGLSNYVRIKRKDKKDLVSYLTLAAMESKLPASLFVRVHRSFIVGIHKVESLTKNYLNIEDYQIPIGESFKKDLFKKLNQKIIIH